MNNLQHTSVLNNQLLFSNCSILEPKAAPSYQPPQVQVAKAAPAKPWAPPPAQVPKSSAHPSAPPVPTGIGATRGKRGDAAMNPAILPSAGHIPMCVGCHLPIRYWNNHMLY